MAKAADLLALVDGLVGVSRGVDVGGCVSGGCRSCDTAVVAAPFVQLQVVASLESRLAEVALKPPKKFNSAN